MFSRSCDNEVKSQIFGCLLYHEKKKPLVDQNFKKLRIKTLRELHNGYVALTISFQETSLWLLLPLY